jgi:hypothetical protein
MHTKSAEVKFMEHYKILHMVQSIYNDNGLPYDIDRSIISLIAQYLNYFSEDYTYRHIKNMIAREEFYLLKHSEIQPWQYLQRDVELWRKKPIIAYIKKKITRAPFGFFKRILIAMPLTQPIAEYLQYRVIEKWGPNVKQNICA